MTVLLVLSDLCSVLFPPCSHHWMFEVFLCSLLIGAAHTLDYLFFYNKASPPPVSLSKGLRQLSDNFLYHPRIARDPGKGMQKFSINTVLPTPFLLHLPHVDLWICCHSGFTQKKVLWGAPKLIWHFPRAHLGHPPLPVNQAGSHISQAANKLSHHPEPFPTL